ncbi:MAG TPA: sigma-54 dependent transcriptional regulator, partial [Polyangiaceae bacterium]|nr:sigma-54 dependent transcriptional regulator [Polyangiaceae bacterium]
LMGVERFGSNRADLVDDLELEQRGSETRLRAVRAIGESGETSEAPPRVLLALLAGHERELRRLCLRLDVPRDGFVSIWLERLSHSALHADEASIVAPALRSMGNPLLESLGSGRLERAELAADELFGVLRASSLGVNSALALIGAFEDAAARRAAGAELSPTIRAVGQFFTCVAVRAFGGGAHSPALEQSSERVRAKVERRSAATYLVGESRCMVELRAAIADLAMTRGAVLIVGESGTGKELVAKALHELGPLAQEPFVAINCAALPRELIESELFGHERGAFTGSRESAPGLLRAAGGGSVFLDEITEMPQALQPKLLRALEQRAVRPVGGLRELPFRARIVAATNADPEALGESQRLRPDLFYRLCVHRIDVPPLRERCGDIPLLVEHFLRELECGGLVPEFSAEAIAALQRYPWPGNVRELRNAVEHASATAKGGRIEVRHLPARVTRRDESTSLNVSRSMPMGDELSLRLVERRHIEHVLQLSNGNKARAARLLGLSRHQLYLKLERFGIG